MFSPYLSKINNKQDKKERLIFNLSILGILLFLAIAITLPFQDQLLNVLLFPKQPSQAATEVWGLVGIHPQAANQPTAAGKKLYTLVPWNGKLYAGYGDYGANTGPISISPFDPVTRTFSTVHILNTEQIENLRIISGSLYAPSTDPRGSDFAVGEAGDVWKSNSPVTMTHNFDMTTLTGSDLWMVGSKGYYAVAWRSLDGGITWQESLKLGDGINPYRFYSVGTLPGKLYVHATTNNTGSVDTVSKVFDGTTWTNGPRLLNSYEQGWRPIEFAGKMVYRAVEPSWNGGTRILKVFNGTTASYVPNPAGGSTWASTDLIQEGPYLYHLSGTTIWRTTNLSTWEKVAGNAPTTAYSLAVLNGKYYVGTTDSKIYEYDPGIISTSPSPTGILPTLSPTIDPSASPTAFVTPTNTPSPLPTLPADTTSPSVSIISPANGSVVSRNTTLTITAVASDNIGVNRVEFYLNGSLRCTDTTATYACTIKVGGKPRASYTIVAKAYDAANNSASSSVGITTQ